MSQPGQVLVIPKSGVPAMPDGALVADARPEIAAQLPERQPTTAPTAPAKSKSSTHVVKPGDTLYGVARRYGVTIPALALFGWGAGFGWWYYAGVAAAAVILAYEHQLVRPGDLSRLDAAFFRMNAVMSVTVFGFALLDRLT